MWQRTVLVTGSTSGIGLATARALGAHGAAVVVHGRSEERVRRATAQLQAADVQVAGGFAADLSDRGQTEQLAQYADSLGIDALVNNAGVYLRERTDTAEGREMTWMVNHVHPTLLTVLVLDGLLDRGGRVVNVSAVVHGRARLNLDDPEFITARYNHFHAYANSKLANLLMAREFARRDGVGSQATFNAVHPGVVSTKLLTEGMRVEGHDPASKAGEAVAALVLDPAVGAMTGRYFEGTVPTEPTGAGTDDALAARLYDLTMNELGF